MQIPSGFCGYSYPGLIPTKNNFITIKTSTMLKELLFQALSGVITEELKTLLAVFKANNGEDKYNELILSIKNSFLLLKTVTDKTKTKIDDTIVGIVLDAVTEKSGL